MSWFRRYVSRIAKEEAAKLIKEYDMAQRENHVLGELQITEKLTVDGTSKFNGSLDLNGVNIENTESVETSVLIVDDGEEGSQSMLFTPNYVFIKNLPTEAPAEADQLWRDSNNFLRITPSA